jgi:hypothetical protein
VTVAEEEKLRLGKGVAFVEGRLKRLPQGDDDWEADSEALPQPIMQTETRYLGMVVTKTAGSLLADLPVRGRPTVNDLATLLAHAMRRPLDGDARLPKPIHLRGHHQWRELFPVLKELGVEVTVERKLPGIEKAYRESLRRLRDEQRTGMVKPSPTQAKVEFQGSTSTRFIVFAVVSLIISRVFFQLAKDPRVKPQDVRILSVPRGESLKVDWVKPPNGSAPK